MGRYNPFSDSEDEMGMIYTKEAPPKKKAPAKKGPNAFGPAGVKSGAKASNASASASSSSRRAKKSLLDPFGGGSDLDEDDPTMRLTSVAPEAPTASPTPYPNDASAPSSSNATLASIPLSTTGRPREDEMLDDDEKIVAEEFRALEEKKRQMIEKREERRRLKRDGRRKLQGSGRLRPQDARLRPKPVA
ncbi:hypothetical protein V498_06907 [Pseudogymnoascus sp. VKM F-4517 (FW-2822)]|nr:hypothetical protein V498_06907 [Pseudogymnoascus sp. VKM F-4517 (FW-2822)]